MIQSTLTNREGISVMRLLAALLLALALGAQDPTTWPQFRGPNLSAIAATAPPVEFGPSKNLLWKQALPAGHSSPAIWGDRIFLTGFYKESKKLGTIGTAAAFAVDVLARDLPILCYCEPA